MSLILGPEAVEGFFRDRPKSLSCYWVVDRNVWRYHENRLRTLSGPEGEFHYLLWDSGEASKTLGNLQTLTERLLDKGVTKAATIILVGGGSLIDLGVTVAANLFRGVSYLTLPTTLLSQVDAGIGGKGAVNIGRHKNVFGAIHFPSAVAVLPEFLKSLPKLECRSGLGEIFKHALLEPSGKLLTELEAHLCNHGNEVIPSDELIFSHAEFKSSVVDQDPFEATGQRIFLNLGHTFAHALESYSDYTIVHGVAVAWGVGVAVALSEFVLSQSREETTQAVRLSKKISGELRIDPFRFLEHFQIELQMDKKNIGQSSRFVLLEGFGRPKLVLDPDRKSIQAAVERLCYGND